MIGLFGRRAHDRPVATTPTDPPSTDVVDPPMPAFGRRQALIGFGAAAVAVAAAACEPGGGGSPATTTTSPSMPPTTAPPTTTTTTTTPVTSAPLHVARRLSFGATPELVAEITALGTTAWIDRQLAWESIDDSATDAIVASFPRALQTAAQITAGGSVSSTRREMAAATMARAVWGRRHLHEMLVDFWSNHFNIDINHDASTRHVPTHDRDVIRKFATGRFADLLVAVATSPAMLLYLDQALSRADGGRLPNENYARELLELHTVGVDGGYDETDVKEVAWLLTGWGVVSRNEGGFRFRPQWHSMGPLATGGDVLGWRPDGLTGVAAGEALLVHLARHPRTAERLAHKLAVRFIGEHIAPTDTVVLDAAAAYRNADTAIAPMVRALLVSAEFRDSAGRRLRRPMEWFASLVRAVRLQWDPARALNFQNAVMSQLALLGQVPLAWPSPDGYPDADDRWCTAGAMVARWNLATAASNGFGATAPQFDATRIFGATAPATVGDALDRAALVLVGEPLDASTRAAILGASGLVATAPWRSGSARAVITYILQAPRNQVR